LWNHSLENPSDRAAVLLTGCLVCYLLGACRCQGNQWHWYACSSRLGFTQGPAWSFGCSDGGVLHLLPPVASWDSWQVQHQTCQLSCWFGCVLIFTTPFCKFSATAEFSSTPCHSTLAISRVSPTKLDPATAIPLFRPNASPEYVCPDWQKLRPINQLKAATALVGVPHQDPISPNEAARAPDGCSTPTPARGYRPTVQLAVPAFSDLPGRRVVFPRGFYPRRTPRADLPWPRQLNPKSIRIEPRRSRRRRLTVTWALRRVEGAAQRHGIASQSSGAPTINLKAPNRPGLAVR
jgi:hypothetical protein